MQIITRDMEIMGNGLEMGFFTCTFEAITDNEYHSDERGSGWEVTVRVKLRTAMIGGFCADRAAVAAMIGEDELRESERLLSETITSEIEGEMLADGTLAKAPAMFAAQ